MFRRLMLLALTGILCAACSALPAEERSFAVAVGLSCQGDDWIANARIPDYQQEGGYVTLTARGRTLTEAMSLLDAAAPMRMHYGQVRLLVFDRALAESAAFPAALTELADMPGMRLQAQVCVTEADMAAFMDALSPLTGTRLSKSLDIVLDTHQRLGVIPEASLSALMRMGERQCAALPAASLTEQEGGDAADMPVQGAGEMLLSGCWLADASGRVRGSLTSSETQLLMLLQGRLRKATVILRQGTVTLSDAGSRIRLDGNHVTCAMTLRYTAASLPDDALGQAVQDDARQVIARLADAGCDALGLGGQAIRHFPDMEAWHGLDWPGLYPSLTWEVRVNLLPPA
ncbi:MAG: Ger(x)C family spore germination C-terminal domain-containing protein [Aristaeellaceae bacterium]